MAWDKKKELLAAENVALHREVELLRELIAEHKADKIELQKQLRHTQDALVAKEAPEAYRDRMDAEIQAELNSVQPSDAQLENARKQRVRSDTASRYLQDTEGSLFKDADDMIQMLTRATGVPLGQEGSLHGNDES